MDQKKTVCCAQAPQKQTLPATLPKKLRNVGRAGRQPHTGQMPLNPFDELTKRSASKSGFQSPEPINHAREMHATGRRRLSPLPINPVQRMLKYESSIQKPGTAVSQPTNRSCLGNAARVISNARTVNDQNAAAYVAFFLLLTNTQNEAATLTWERINFDEGRFYAKKDIAKNHNALTFPLSDTLRLLEGPAQKEIIMFAPGKERDTLRPLAASWVELP
jgi:hypothetical protein